MRHQVVHRRLPHRQLAQRGQHLLDVVQEGPVRPDDQGAGAGQPLPVRVQQIRHPVQPHRRLPGAGPSLHAHGPAEPAAHDLVLLRLDGRHDVPHRADTRPLDLPLEQLAGLRRLRRVGQMLVLVRREVAARVAEAAAQRDVLRVLLRRPVERLGDRCTPVDHHRVAVRVVHMTPSDVEPLALRTLRPLRARCVQIVEAAEEQRGVAEVRQRLDALVDLAGEDGGVDPVRGDVADVERLDVLAHGPQRGAGGGEVGALAVERTVGGRGRGGRCGRGQGCASVKEPGPAVGARRDERPRGAGTGAVCAAHAGQPAGFRPVGGTPRGGGQERRF